MHCDLVKDRRSDVFKVVKLDLKLMWTFGWFTLYLLDDLLSLEQLEPFQRLLHFPERKDLEVSRCSFRFGRVKKELTHDTTSDSTNSII